MKPLTGFCKMSLFERGSHLQSLKPPEHSFGLPSVWHDLTQPRASLRKGTCFICSKLASGFVSPWRLWHTCPCVHSVPCSPSQPSLPGWAWAVMAANRQSLSSGLARALLASLLPHSCCLVTAFHAGLMLQNLSICENPVTDSQPPREPLLKRRGPQTLLVRACLALPTGFMAIHAATEGDFFTQQGKPLRGFAFTVTATLKLKKYPSKRQSPGPSRESGQQQIAAGSKRLPTVAF